MSEWKKVKLGECITTKKGFAFKSALYTSKGVPVVRVSDFTLNSISDNDLVYYPVSEYEKYKEFVLAEKDILIQTVGSWQYNPNSVVGKVVRVPYYHQGSLLNQNIVKIMPIEGVDKNYLYYRIKCIDFSGFVIGEARGAANQASITLDTIKRFPICLPPSKEQQKIGTILSRYDSLIENYQKQIKLLEEATQRLYKEWFVDLRFPGHENTKIVDGVPEGWAFYRIGDIFKTVLGGTPSRAKSNYWGGNIPWINSGEINKLRIIKPSEMITKEGYDNSATKLMPVHTTILAITGATLGKVSYTEIETCANQSVVGIIDESKQKNEYLYLNISNNILSIVNKATGGAQQHINKDIVNAYPFLLPNKDILDRFKKIVAPMFRQIKNNLIQIESLTEARDRLLPKLMSGEITI